MQVARQGNPLFNEGLVAIVDKDLYSRTSPTVDNRILSASMRSTRNCALINAAPVAPWIPGRNNRTTDIAAIYIPDLIKVDLSTPGVRLRRQRPSGIRRIRMIPASRA